MISNLHSMTPLEKYGCPSYLFYADLLLYFALVFMVLVAIPWGAYWKCNQKAKN